MLNIFLFFLLAIMYIAYSLYIKHLREEKKFLLGGLLLIAAIMWQPLVFMWYIKYILNYTLTYWQAFMLILVLDLYTFKTEKRKDE
jgi:lipopolysaccharide export LptBFGC system permease protein LptF